MCPNWLRRTAFVLILAGLILSACANQPLAKVGHWEGSPSVSFDVTEAGEVTNFSIDVEACVISVKTAVAISDGQRLEMGTVNSEGLPEKDGIVGTFSSPTQISGTYANPIACILPDGRTTITSNVSIDSNGNASYELPTWDAKWQAP